MGLAVIADWKPKEVVPENRQIGIAWMSVFRERYSKNTFPEALIFY